jgi:hypothetical protein
MVVGGDGGIKAVAALREELGMPDLSEFECKRFLKSNGQHLGKAAKQYRIFQEWRERERILDTLTEPPYCAEIEAELDRIALRMLDGTDLMGRPVLVGNLGNVDVLAHEKKGVSVAMMVRRHAKKVRAVAHAGRTATAPTSVVGSMRARVQMEEMLLRLDDVSDPQAGCLIIFDLGECTASRFFRAWAYIREVAHIGQAYYPEVLGQMAFLRGPKAAVYAIDKVKLLLDESTRRKLQLS